MVKKDQPNHMWNYWNDKYYTPTAAVRSEYPNLLMRDPSLLAKVQAAEDALDAVSLHMAHLADDFPYEAD